MSAVLESAHLAPPRPAGTVYTYAPQPSAARTSLTAVVTSHTKGVPVLNSRPGAAYTVYLDFAGFNYVGDWNGRVAGTDTVPGFTPSFNDASPTGTFTAAEKAAITTVWARMAQSYSSLDVNITTVDPAPAAIAGDDVARRDFYDAKPNFMHMVFGSSLREAYVTAENPDGNWLPGADGVSPGIGVAAGKADGPNANQGQHTSFMFTQGRADNGGAISNINAEYVGGIGSHENAHSFGLNHQGDYANGGVDKINEYTFGDDPIAPNNYGTYIAIIGDANNRQRITWRDGIDDEQDENDVFTRVNDLQRLLAKSSAAFATAEGRTGGVDLHFIDDGIGNNLASATALPLIGSNVNFSLAKGVIVPKSESNPLAIGAGNYTTDYFSFYSDGAKPITLTVTDSTSFLIAGKADSDGTLNSTLNIYKADGTLVGTSTEDVTTLKDTYTGTLAAGKYFAAVGSNGGHQQVNAEDFDSAYYFDTGAFFLTGSGFSSVVIPPTPKPPRSFVGIDNPRVREGNNGLTAMTFTVFLTNPSTKIVTMEWKTVAGDNAKAGKDFIAAQGKLTFQPGVTKQTITIYIKGNKVKEPNKKVLVNLFNLQNASLADGSGKGTIVNDD